MSTITASEANDIMLSTVQELFGEQYTILYENKGGVIPTAEDSIWMKPFVRHSGSRQTSLADHLGKARYDVWGVLFIQLFFPLGKGLETPYNVSEELAQLLRKYKSQVWFRNVKWEEIGPDGKFYQFKLTAQFEYTQVR